MYKIVEYNGEYAVAIKLASNLSDKWQAGDTIVFWPDGDITADDGCKTIGSFSVLDIAQMNDVR